MSFKYGIVAFPHCDLEWCGWLCFDFQECDSPKVRQELIIIRRERSLAYTFFISYKTGNIIKSS